ncbi:MAG: serine hydrolase domain-containing protein [Solitalea-like symbiont of Tyrophagus putrescentiae]
MSFIKKNKNLLYYIGAIIISLLPILIIYISIPHSLYKQNNGTKNKLSKNANLSLYKQCITPKFIITDIQEELTQQKINFEKKQQALDTIFSQLYKKGIINGNVLIAQKKIILYRQTFGYSSLNNKDPLNEKSQFQIASLSKTFTAVAILKLYEQGLLDLDDTIQKYIPGFPYDGVTIRMLLSHRSGIPNYIYAFADKAKNGLQRPTNKEILQWFIEQKPKRYYLPDKKFSYNNSNYMILGSIIETISKNSYEEYLQKNILAPLEMHSTVLPPNSYEKLTNSTYGHEGFRRIDTDFFDNIIGDKGIYTTTDDLYKWYQALQTNCLLKEETLNEAFKVHSPEKTTAFNYGYGFRLLTDGHNNTKGIFHTGWWKGYNALFYFDKQNEFIVIMLLNKRSHIVYNKSFLYTVFTKLQLFNTYHAPVSSNKKTFIKKKPTKPIKHKKAKKKKQQKNK